MTDQERLAEHRESERTGIPRPSVAVLDLFTRAINREVHNPRVNQAKVKDILGVLFLRTYPHWFTEGAFAELRERGLRVAPREKVRL